MSSLTASVAATSGALAELSVLAGQSWPMASPARRGGRLASGRSGGRHRFRAIAIFAVYIAGGWLFPGRKRVVPYSIQTLKRLKPALFRQDLIALLELLQQKKIKPLIAQRFPLAKARGAGVARKGGDRQDRASAQRVIANGGRFEREQCGFRR